LCVNRGGMKICQGKPSKQFRNKRHSKVHKTPTLKQCTHTHTHNDINRVNIITHVLKSSIHTRADRKNIYRIAVKYKSIPSH
jgi:hypothetical protein